MKAGRVVVLGVVAMLMLSTACSEDPAEPDGAKPAAEDEQPGTDEVDNISPLDLKDVVARTEGANVVFTVTTYEPWTAKDVEPPNKMFVHISTAQEEDDYARFLNITSNGSLVCEFFYGDGSFIGNVPVSRPDDRSVSCAVKARHLPDLDSQLRWVGETKALRPGDEPGRPRVSDRAPDSGEYSDVLASGNP